MMKNGSGQMLFGAVVALFSPATASAYEVDCAILLCLSAGWPASTECNHARNVFIQRITPWPVDPPLQIWRCPMGAAVISGPGKTPSERLYKLAVPASSKRSDPGTLVSDRMMGDDNPVTTNLIDERSVAAAAVLKVAWQVSTESDTADIDISGPEFDFIRSIRVWNVMRYSHAPRGSDHECREISAIRLGTYGTQGSFHWKSISSTAVPNWVIPSKTCYPSSSTRAVGVEWTDYQGNHGYEVVRY